MEITGVRCVLLSSPYSFAEDAEIRECFPNGPKRTIGMVEITLANGVTGIGEGYLAVFAPRVFEAIVDLCAPHVMGEDGFDISSRHADLRRVCDYWSLQGAARHVISAFDIAFHDAKAKSKGVPAWELIGCPDSETLRVYGSGGCCDSRDHFQQELELLESCGITLYKMRATRHEVLRTIWVMEEAGLRGIDVGVDMCQNLADPPQSAEQAKQFIDSVHAGTRYRIGFLEEAIGPDCPEGFKALRAMTDVPVCGGEIITTPGEMIRRITDEIYDFVQPDASVIGGISAMLPIFSAGRRSGTEVVAHAWGGAAAMMANYHVAFAAGGKLVEYPLLDFPLADDMLAGNCRIKGGELQLPRAPGIGVNLTQEIESRYPFDESAVYSCKPVIFERNPQSHWHRASASAK